MDITLLWSSLVEEGLKDEIILGKPAWSYTQDLFAALGGHYYQPGPQDYDLLSSFFVNRNFLVKKDLLPKKPVLYFVGHYPTLPKDLVLAFMERASAFGQAVLYAPSPIWLEEKELICFFLQPNKEGSLEQTLRSPLVGLVDQGQIKKIEQILYQKHNMEWIEKGVEIRDIYSTWIDAGVEIGKGVVLEPNTYICGDTKIGQACRIGPNCQIKDSFIGSKTRIIQAQVENSRIGQECNIGPFTYIRPHSNIGDRVRLGDFVEIKNSRIGDDSMISHLTYVGDADVGKNVNFGCGSILVNYDGMGKHRSQVGDNAFIGCNSNLVSPVFIGKGAFIAAGSTITQDLPPDSLGIARVRQEIKENWVTNRKKNIEGGKTNEQS